MRKTEKNLKVYVNEKEKGEWLKKIEKCVPAVLVRWLEEREGKKGGTCMGSW